MDGYGNDEQRAAYRDGLLVEKDGYAARVAQAKTVGDADAVDRYQGRMAQVDAELARLDGADGVELSPAEKLAAAKNLADYDALAAELGFDWPAGVTTKAQKQAALEEHLAA